MENNATTKLSAMGRAEGEHFVLKMSSASRKDKVCPVLGAQGLNENVSLRTLTIKHILLDKEGSLRGREIILCFFDDMNTSHMQNR